MKGTKQKTQKENTMHTPMNCIIAFESGLVDGLGPLFVDKISNLVG